MDLDGPGEGDIAQAAPPTVDSPVSVRVSDVVDAASPVGDSAPSAPVDAPLPVDTPAWFSDNYGLLSRQELGDRYKRLLRAWRTLEGKHKFDIAKGSKVKISAAKPDALWSWIAAGRTRSKKQPVIADVKVFSLQLIAWWCALQPAWRKIDYDGLPKAARAGGGEWGQPLETHGQNGMLSVVACLAWWAVALGASRESDMQWRRMVDDVTWVCEAMAKEL
ncbi:hypothetical protein BD626DRAFT_404777 [Schizophyllum amplum]|uniref:Uncharacterized protein n=1 Tax=Schizophyllum amplum TaxID=97359 RepID=A0A550CAZ8_9AGAR|nr:hypothetical protein BD626DRAFT_404777 [Auriculariopsis ampla]